MAVPRMVQRRLDRLAGAPIPSGALSISDAAALEQVGFRQVGEVVGATAFAVPARSFFAYGTGALFTPSYPPGWRGGANGEEPVVLTSSTARDGRVPTLISALKAGYRDALKRLENEVQAIGADGAVGVRISRRLLEDNDERPVWGFLATGTAVRSIGRTRASQPFTSALRGGEFAALLRAGWLALRYLACPVMAARWIDAEDQGRRSRRAPNSELHAHTVTVNACRHQARTDFAAAARGAGGDGAIMSGMTLDFDSEWQTAQATVLVTGTAMLHIRPGPEPAVQVAMSMGRSR